MRHWPAWGSYLERYEVADGTGVLGIANEGGDITAYVRRPDGTRGHCYGGPVYDPEPEFLNVYDMTPTERAVANVFARTVGWMP